MSKQRALAVFLFHALAGFLLPVKGLSQQSLKCSLLPDSKVIVKGATNINFFECLSAKATIPGQTMLRLSEQNDKAWLSAAIISVEVNSLECGSEAMNESLYESLKVPEYPEIRIEVMEAFSVDREPMQWQIWEELEVKTVIEIAGIRKTHFIKTSGMRIGPNRYRIMGEHFLLMSSFGITPPTALFGMVKVKDGITVSFNLEVQVFQAMPGS